MNDSCFRFTGRDVTVPGESSREDGRRAAALGSRPGGHVAELPVDGSKNHRHRHHH